MRASDRIKSQGNMLNKLHDKQIYDTKHDRIVKWLYDALGKNVCSAPHHIWAEIAGDSAEVSGWRPEQYKIVIEEPVYGPSQMPIGFIDLAIYFQYANFYTGELSPTERRLIEVKSNVNIGETVRQIKYYGGPVNWLVCAPACDDVQLLREQGIGFIEYEPDLLFE